VAPALRRDRQGHRTGQLPPSTRARAGDASRPVSSSSSQGTSPCPGATPIER
jgi:hypothetical protein